MVTDRPAHPGSMLPLLVGRGHEQTVLHDHLTAAIAGQSSLILISGEAGIGKTALAESVCREAAEQGELVLIGRCYDLSETPPYGPWMEVFERYHPNDNLPPLPTAFAERGIVGQVASQSALFTQVRDFVTSVAAHQPLIILLDDLHWADPTSLDLLRFLARSVASLPILLIATYRAEELADQHPLATLVPLLVREANTLRIALRPLSARDIQTVVTKRYRLAHEPANRLATYLSNRSEGNPFFLGELLRAVEEEGIVQKPRDDWFVGDLTTAQVPLLLQQVIAGRVRRLSEESQRQLRVAAVIGQDVPMSIWATVLDVDEDSLARDIEQAMVVHLMEEAPDGTHARFVHALIRETLYASIRPSERRRIHCRVAEALAALPHPDPDAVSYHFRQAGDGRAFRWFFQAGERAAAVYAWLTAADRFEAALAMIDRSDAGPGEHGWLLYFLAWFRRWSDPTQGIAYLEEAERCAAIAEDRILAAFAVYSRGIMRCISGDFTQGLDEMEIGVAARRALTPTERERLRSLPLTDSIRDKTDGQGSLIQWLTTAGRFADARRIGERARTELIVNVPRDGTRDSSYGDLYLGLAQVYAGLGLIDEATHAYQQTRQVYRALGHDYMVGTTATNEFGCMLPYYADRPAKLHGLLAEIETLWERAVDRAPDYQRRYPRAVRLLLDGQWTEGLQHFLGMEKRVPRQYQMRQLLGPIAHAQGDTELAWAFVHAQLPDGTATEPGSQAFRSALSLLRIAAALALDTNDRETAKAWLEAHDRWVQWSGGPLGRADGAVAWAAYYRAADDRALASQHADQALKEASSPRQPLVLLAAHRLLGELATDAGQFDAAFAHLDAARALADACALPFERALTLLALAELHRARDERQEALARAEEVRAICVRLDAKPTIARADALIARLSEPPTRARVFPAGLSAREVEVLSLLATGQTNREIADTLSISIWTVKQHVAHILNKTDAENRSAAVAFALRHHLA